MLATKLKSGKGTERSHYRFSLDELRQAADQTMEVFQLTRKMRRWLKSIPTEDKNVRTFTIRNQLAIAANLKGQRDNFEIKRPVAPARPRTLIPLPPSGGIKLTQV